MRLTKSELKQLQKAYYHTKNTPVMLVGDVDISKDAAEAFQQLWADISKKYNIDPKKSGFHLKTGEIFTEEAI